MNTTDVLIVGAGPTGLVLALYLHQMGVAVRIVDAAPKAGTTSRALAVQARTVELYQQIGIADEVVARAHRVPAINLWVRGDKRARVMFGDIGHHLSPYSFVLIFPQDQHEELLERRLRERGIEVERNTSLTGFTQDADGTDATLRLPDGSAQDCSASFLVGCDGAHSTVRQRLGIGFPGGTYSQVFYVADVDAEGPAVDGELHVDLDDADFLAVFPLAGRGRARLIGTVRDERAEHPEVLGFGDVSDRAIEHMHLKVNQVNWFSTYRVHHRVAEHFRVGRSFLLGDAAHIHSPAGGQGMNTGIGDAVNLAWKLAAVLAQRADTRLLDSYEIERMSFARRLVATTDRVFTFATADGPVAEVVRTRLAPILIPTALGFEQVREFMFRTVSQLALNYRAGPLSQGQAGKVHGGDRLPWAGTDHDNFADLPNGHWQIHVYGQPSSELVNWCKAHAMTPQVFAWSDAHAAAGLARDATYLLRPDGYVAFCTSNPAAVTQMQNFLLTRGLQIA